MTRLLRTSFVLATLTFLTLPSLAQAPLIRVNAGGPEATAEGTTFISDTYFTDSKTAQVTVEDIAGTEADIVFGTERISPDDLSPFGYKFPVENGTYTIQLHFAETTFKNAGKRLFDVEVEGSAVIEDYDIFEASTGQNIAIVETIPNITVNDDTLNIDFLAVLERAKVNAIEIFGSANTISIPFAVNAGSEEDYAGGGLTFLASANEFFLEGTAFTGSGEIENTGDDPLYLSELFGNNIRFVVPGMQEGRYTVQLYFAETFHSASGQRLFDISVEGEVVRPNYDIFDAAGAQNTAVIEVIENVTVADGILNISLVKSVSSAKINGIAVTTFSPVSNEAFDEDALPGTHRLSSAFPNPFNPQTNFTLEVAQTQEVNIGIYNVLGQKVTEIFNGMLSERQNHAFQFEAGDLPSGIYLIQAQGEHFVQSQQVVLLK